MSLAFDQWHEVSPYLDQVLSLPEGERGAWLQSVRVQRPDLAGLLEELLEEHRAVEQEKFLEETPIQRAFGASLQGQKVGVYTLVSLIGQGGMGEVWLAEQKEPVRRRVALKLIKAGANTREVILRFAAERQALALMDHPAIAKVFEAGSTPQGTPYFVMEYVSGVPITAYCDNHGLSIRERLELFMQVCEGVQHAHQKAIIHRDLKPSNILVLDIDGRAAPKIIDFGVAKVLTERLTAETMYTRVGTLVGTPEYMSPEQAHSSGEDIDTRTDVYSLGIVFYELLTGGPPLDLRKASLEEFLRRMREEEPPKPSTKFRAHGPATSMAVAEKRQTDPPALVKQMRGELDSIALKALEKERARRYASPSDFAADIERHLNNEAVLAVPPSLAYRAHKLVRRHRGSLVTAVAFALVLIAAAVISIRQSIRAGKEAAVASREAAVAQAVNDFLQNDLLAQASAARQSRSGTKPDPDLTVRTALDRAAEHIEGKFAMQPEVEASIRTTIGQTYEELGLYPEARKQLERALAIQTRVLGEENPKTLCTQDLLGWTDKLQGKYPEAEALLSQSLAGRRRVLGLEHRDTLGSMNDLAVLYVEEGKYTQAEALDRQALETRRRVLGPEHPDTLISTSNLAEAYTEEGKFAQAEALDNQALEVKRRVLGPEHPETLISLNDLANVYYDEGKYVQAERLYHQVLEVRRRILGPEHRYTLSSITALAAVYEHEGKYAQAETLDNQVLEVQRRILGPDHPDTLNSINSLAVVYSDDGKYAQAEALDRQVLDVRRRVLGPEHPATLASLNNLADDYTDEGEYAQAETLFNQAVAIAKRVEGPEHPDTLLFLSDFAGMYQRKNNYALAQKYAAMALAGRRRSLGSEDTDTMASAADLALAYVSERKFDESEPLAREAMETAQWKQTDDWQRFRAESLLGDSLAGQKKYAEAEPLLLDGYQGMLDRKDRIGAHDRYHLQLAHQWLVQLYKDWGKPQKVAEVAKELEQ